MAGFSDNEAMLNKSSEEKGDEDDYNWLELQSNVYSAGIASVVQQIDNKDGHSPAKRLARVTIAAVVVLLAVSLQVFFVIKVKSLVCAKSVHAIREIYSTYEEHMYSETYMTVNNKHRGSGDEFFLPENFDTLDDALKTDVCQFPLTQPDFLSAILYMWTLVIFAEVRRCWSWAKRFLYITPTDKEDWVHVTKEEHAKKYGLEEGETGLKSLSITIKVIIGVVFTIQTVTALFLLWVGCRWLTATPAFADLILNGLALAFIVEIKDMLYDVLLPRLFQQETEIIRVRREAITSDWGTLLVPVGCGVAGALWVWLYMFHIQAVLPDYRWDVKLPCFEFLMQMTAV